MKQNQWLILPSEKAAERARRERFRSRPEKVHLGNTIFSLRHFVNTLAKSTKPILSRRLQKHLLQKILRSHSLRYFEKLRHLPGLAQTFLTAIRRLKQFAISPALLEEKLRHAGSLREFDLLKTYQRYETSRETLGALDLEDPIREATRSLDRPDSPLHTVDRILFQHFIDLPKGITVLLAKMKKRFPGLSIRVEDLKEPKSELFANTTLFSLPTPYQETDWFLENMILQGEEPNQTGILVGDLLLYYEPIRQKLKRIGLAKGPSPFLTWGERPEGRQIKEEAKNLPLKEGTLGNWLGYLFKKCEGDLREHLTRYLFCESKVTLGVLKAPEWLLWLSGALEERPIPPLADSLEGIQWISLADGDFPTLSCLWVPGFTADQWRFQPTTAFFQEARDRSLPEWDDLTQAFEDPKEIYRKKRLAFFHLLAKAPSGAWLTFPRIDSQGRDITPSPLTWDLGEITPLEAATPPLWKPDPTLEKKRYIEEERVWNRFQNKTYHGDLLGGLTHVQKEDYVFSPTQLEIYAQCPFKYYARRVLGVPQVKEYSPEVDPEDRGTLFHQILEELLKRYGDLYREAVEDRQKEECLYEKLTVIGENVFKEHQKERTAYAHPELYAFLKEKSLSQAKEVIARELETARQIESPLFPKYFEWGFETKEKNELGLRDSQWKKPIRFKGFIDRIDCDAKEERFLILDYKTGTTTAQRERLLQGLTLQLPFYLLAVQKLLLKKARPVGGLLISAREGKRKHGLVNRAFNKIHFRMRKNAQAMMAGAELEKMTEQTVAQIQDYVGQIRRGFFSPVPKECKTSCDYKEICRYAHKPF